MSAISFNNTNAYHFPSLSLETVFTVFGFLDSQALHTASHVCRFWNQLVNNENFPMMEWNKNKCEAGNEILRRDLKKAATDNRKPLSEDVIAVLEKTSNPFSDRTRIVDCILKNHQNKILANAAWKSATRQRCLPLISALFPLTKGTCHPEEAIRSAIQRGNIDLVKSLLPHLNEQRAREKICIRVQYPTEEGESLSLLGCIGVGSGDLNSWKKGFPMKKVRGSNNLWEIILVPVVYGKTTCEYDPLKDNILFPFKPALHLTNGQVRTSEALYHIKPRTDISIKPEFQV